jgi:aminoglycoside phosphotransferase (APT) family kinase protein
MASEEIPGYDVAAVEPWVCQHVEGFVAPFRWTKLEGGHSNLTYQIESAGGDRSAVIRRPPLGELLPKAHDMGREWACISGLWGTGVPVAEPLAYCPGPEVTGAHFYVMGEVDGRALYDTTDVKEWIPEDRRMTTALSWIDVLGELHSLDPDELGLGELGRKEDYVVRQINTWYRSWTSSTESAAIDDPIIHELHDFLLAEVPEQGPATVVHGDYGTHNVLIGRDAKVAAVVDWEIATLGDPLADFAYSMNAWVEADDPLLDRSDAASLAPGFPPRDVLVDRYAARTGSDLSDLPYYRAYNRFKSACIIHGVYARYRRGQKAIAPADLEHMRQRVLNGVKLAEMAGNEIR